MQDGSSPAYAASQDGHTETVALLLADKADVNAAKKVQQFKIFKYLLLIDNELQDFFTWLFHIINDFSTFK